VGVSLSVCCASAQIVCANPSDHEDSVRLAVRVETRASIIGARLGGTPQRRRAPVRAPESAASPTPTVPSSSSRTPRVQAPPNAITQAHTRPSPLHPAPASCEQPSRQESVARETSTPPLSPDPSPPPPHASLSCPPYSFNPTTAAFEHHTHASPRAWSRGAHGGVGRRSTRVPISSTTSNSPLAPPRPPGLCDQQ
jgi:hypothetical protein